MSNRYRWVFCQLEALRHCLPPSVRRTLDELPASLDETYERILKEIKRPNREHTLRLLKCLVAAIRPLRIAELAEVLAVDFDDAEGVPKLKVDWRWEDQEQALLSSCSSLIAIISDGESQIVQFSHFSVKEFLTSPRLATSSGDISHYHIDLEPAHTILAEACLGVLLGLDDRVYKDIRDNSPLAQYAARCWVAHAQFKNVSTQVHMAMECFFDPDRPHFAIWVCLYDTDKFSPESGLSLFSPFLKSGATPLYYAALCGFHDLVKRLIDKYPRNVNAHGGYNLRPLMAALAGRHFRTADLLHHNGAEPNVQGRRERTPLHSAAHNGKLELIRKLIEYGADIDARDKDGYTPLRFASEGLKNPTVIRLLLDHGADVNTRAGDLSTPLHMASGWGLVEVARILLEHGAMVEVEDDRGRTPLMVARAEKQVDMIELLLEHGAK